MELRYVCSLAGWVDKAILTALLSKFIILTCESVGTAVVSVLAESLFSIIPAQLRGGYAEGHQRYERQLSAH